jgi:3-oxoacyl-[acyl-carrier protein] reductase
LGKLAGKVAIVTGASRGIGRGIAERLARDGAAVVVNYSGSEAEARSLVATIEQGGGRAVAIQADLSRLPELRRLFAESDAAFGRLDILVNNAGIGAITPLEEVDEETFDRVFALNARAVLFACQEAAKRLGEGGRIINISSSSTVFPMAGTAVYAASKAVPKVFTEVLAKELGGRGITVNSVVPGPVVPGMFAGAPEQFQEMAATSSPFGRLGTPADIADIVAFLAGEESRWISGQHILANGAGSM